eukprot:214375_1
MLRSVLILWKLVLSVLRLEIGALIVKTVMFVVSTIATSVLLLSMILITFRRCVYRDSKLIVEKSSLPQSTVLCSGLLFFNCFVFNLAFPSGFNFISALIYISWYISSKKRNQFMRAINGNPTFVPFPKSISTIGNEGTFRTNHSINLESTPKTSNLTFKSINSNLKSTESTESNSKINSQISNIRFIDYKKVNKNSVIFTLIDNDSFEVVDVLNSNNSLFKKK